MTALKFAELSALAGIPPGVINIVTGSGSVVGEAIARHMDVRKVGFTGSTGVGAKVMIRCVRGRRRKRSKKIEFVHLSVRIQ